MIPKGKTVEILTTNGGRIVAMLLEAYRPTFSVVVARHGSFLVISADRVASVQLA